MKVRVEAPVRPTEVPERVVAAVTQFLPDATLETSPGRVVATGTHLDMLRKRVWELRIIDTFRGKFHHGGDAERRTVRFTLSKQAAYAGKVSFPPRPHALGDLEWTVELEAGDPWKDTEALGWWLAPETRDGEIVGPTEP